MKLGLTNYHGHTAYCDGKGTILSYIEKAIELGVTSLGISSHNPISYNPPWTMKAPQFAAYSSEVRQLQKQFTDQIEVYLGLELDYIPGHLPGMSEAIRKYDLDYGIGSVHYAAQYDDGRNWEIDGPHQMFVDGLRTIFDDNIQMAIQAYYGRIRAMLDSDPPTILGHLDKIKMQNARAFYFNEQDSWYRDEVRKTLRAVANSGVILEVNTRGIYKKLTSEPYPSYWILREAQKLNIPITVNSDAHRPEELINEFEIVNKELKAVGYRKVMELRKGKWVKADLN